MTWRLRRHRVTDPEPDLRAEAADERLRRIEARAARVAPALEQRRKRNHWAEAVQILWQEGRA